MHIGSLDKPGVSNWRETWPNCGGRRQSPINIETRIAQEGTGPKLKFGVGYFGELDGYVVNNGRAGITSNLTAICNYFA